MPIHCENSALEGHGQKIGWLVRLARRWRNVIETQRAERRLSAADDYMLKDIGISRGDIKWMVRHGRRRSPSGSSWR